MESPQTKTKPTTHELDHDHLRGEVEGDYMWPANMKFLLLVKCIHTYINFISIRIVNSTIVLVSPNTIKKEKN